MAVTAKFLADFTDFTTAVAKAEVSLRSFESGAGKVEKSLNRMADSFSGRKIIQDAELAAKAVEAIGGSTKLTSNEQARLNATITEALAKYQALGLQAPASLTKLAAETKVASAEMAKIPSRATDIVGSLRGIAGAIGIGFSIGAVVNFGKSVFNAASEIHDLALQLGISAEAVQGFKYAAEQSGSSLDAVGTALTKMNQHLSAGDKSTVKALKDAGLAFADIRNLKPEDAFLAITDAIQKIPDPMRQTEVAMALFGKSAAQLLPAIKEGFRGVAEGADKMSEDTINSLEKAEDAWESLGNKIVIVTGGMIAHVTDSVSQVTESWAEFARFAEDVLTKGPAIAAALAATRGGRKRPQDILLPSNKPSAALVDPAVLKSANDALSAHTRAVNELMRAYSGKAAIDAANLSIEAVNASARIGIPLMKMEVSQREEINKKLAAGLAAYQAQGKVAPEAMRALYAATLDVTKLIPYIDGIPSSIKKIGDVTALYVVPQLQYVAGIPWGTNIGKEVDIAIPKVKTLTVDFGDMAQALTQLAQVSGTTFGGMVSSLAQVIAAADTAQKSIAQIRKGQDDKEKGNTLAGIIEISSGIIGIVAAAGQAVKAIKAIWGAFDRNKGRDLVVDFAESMGGFDALQEKLMALGDAGGELWIKLTQGVGRNNPAQAQAAIDEVTAALEEQSAQQGEAKSATEEQAQATIETAAQASLALDELGGRLKLNAEEWASWSAAVTGHLSDLANTIRSLPLPTANGPDSGNVSFNAGSGAGGTPQIQTVVYLDGDVLAESVSHRLVN